MKKIILSLIFTLVSIVSFGQVFIKLSSFSSVYSNGTKNTILKGQIFTTDANIYMYTLYISDQNNNSINYSISSNYSLDFNINLPNFYFGNIYIIYIFANRQENNGYYDECYRYVFNSSHIAIGQNYEEMNLCYSRYNEHNNTKVEIIKENKTYKENIYYDLSGRIVEYPIKDKIYIYNGKKVVY